MRSRRLKKKDLRVVTISGIGYVLDMQLRQLRGVVDPADVIELDDAVEADDVR